jgi:hypothetical protein
MSDETTLPVNNGFDISSRLLAISARRDMLIGLIIRHQNELNDLTFEEQYLQHQSRDGDIDRRFKASLDYKAAYIKEVLDL